MEYRKIERCSNNQAEQMAILKALEYRQKMEPEEKIVLVNTDRKLHYNYYKTRRNIKTSQTKLELN